MPWPDTHLLLAAMGAAFLAGLARGFSGFGAALIFVPFGSAILGPRVTAPLLLVVDLVMASPMIPRAWRFAALGPLYGLGLGLGLGLWLGGRLFGLASQRMFRRICFGLILLAAVVGLPLWDR